METNKADVETSDENKDSDVVEVNVLKKDCVKQDTQIQNNEQDMKGILVL